MTNTVEVQMKPVSDPAYEATNSGAENLIKSARIFAIESGCASTVIAIMDLIAALEQAERANAAQDDHISQQADRIDVLEKRNAELGGQLARYSMSPGEADQRRCESRAVREALGFGKDADNVAPIDLRQRIAELEASKLSVKLPSEFIEMYGTKFYMHAHVVEAIRAAGGNVEGGE